MGLVSEFCCNEDEVHQRRKFSKQISSDSENDKDEFIENKTEILKESLNNNKEENEKKWNSGIENKKN